MAISFWKLGDVHYQNLDIEKARDYFRKAEIHWNTLANQFPQYIEFQRNLRFIQNKISETQNVTVEDLIIQKALVRLSSLENQIPQENRPREKVALQQSLVDSLLLLYQKHPQNVIIQSRLSNAYGSLAWFHLFNRQFPEADTSGPGRAHH